MPVSELGEEMHRQRAAARGLDQGNEKPREWAGCVLLALQGPCCQSKCTSGNFTDTDGPRCHYFWECAEKKIFCFSKMKL